MRQTIAGTVDGTSIAITTVHPRPRLGPLAGWLVASPCGGGGWWWSSVVVWHAALGASQSVTAALPVERRHELRCAIKCGVQCKRVQLGYGFQRSLARCAPITGVCFKAVLAQGRVSWSVCSPFAMPILLGLSELISEAIWSFAFAQPAVYATQNLTLSDWRVLLKGDDLDYGPNRFVAPTIRQDMDYSSVLGLPTVASRRAVVAPSSSSLSITS